MRNDTKSVCVLTPSGSVSVEVGARFSMSYSKNGADAASLYVINYVREVFAQFFIADTDNGVRSFRYDRIKGRA